VAANANTTARDHRSGLIRREAMQGALVFLDDMPTCRPDFLV
jgi:hypothetical protein